jgi:Protein of unknown function (DUF938)
MSDQRRYAPATERNREPILQVLKTIVPATGTVLEIASGSGQHSTFFAPHFPLVQWQPSDPDPECLASIASWQAAQPTPNLLPPLTLDAQYPDTWPITACDVMVCINMIHIAPWSATQGLLAGAQRILGPGGLLYLYGPFIQPEQPMAPSNQDFDAALRDQNPAWGIRDLTTVTDLARAHNLHRTTILTMPANNLSIIFCKK